MQRTTKIVLALLLAAALVALIIPVAFSQGGPHPGKARRGWALDEMYNVIKVTGSSDSAVNFDIMGTAIKGKEGRVAIMTQEPPRSGTYYFANDTAVIPFGNMTEKKRQRPVMMNYTNATVNVAGASAIVAMKNITMAGKGRGSCEIQFTDLGVYLPDGTTKTYRLSAPAKVMKSADNSSMLIVGNPSLRSALQGSLMSGATFPANANPVMLKDVDAVK